MRRAWSAPAAPWVGAALVVSAWALAVPGSPLVLVPVEHLPGVGPEGGERVVATVVALLALGALDTVRTALWSRIERGSW